MIKPVYDSKNLMIRLYCNDECIAELSKDEVYAFMDEMKELDIMFEVDALIEQNKYNQVIAEDIECFDDPRIIGINFIVDYMYRLDSVESRIYLLFEDGDYEFLDLPVCLDENFPFAQVKTGRAHSYQIRKCFDDKVIQYFLENPNFIVQFNGKDISRNVLRGETEMTFAFGKNGDT